jgi:hypothetical protein
MSAISQILFIKLASSNLVNMAKVVCCSSGLWCHVDLQVDTTESTWCHNPEEQNSQYLGLEAVTEVTEMC